MRALELKPEKDKLYRHFWFGEYVEKIPEKTDFWDEIISRLYKLLEVNPEFIDIATIVIGIYCYSDRNDLALKAIQDFKIRFPGEAEIDRLERAIVNSVDEKKE